MNEIQSFLLYKERYKIKLKYETKSLKEVKVELKLNELLNET